MVNCESCSLKSPQQLLLVLRLHCSIFHVSLPSLHLRVSSHLLPISASANGEWEFLRGFLIFLQVAWTDFLVYFSSPHVVIVLSAF